MQRHILHAAVALSTALLLAMPARAATPSAGTACSHGVDIYHGTSENGQINWNLLAQTQGFAYIKCDEGTSHVDPMWTSNRNAAAAYGMAWGPYHFLRLNSDPIVQADNYWTRIKGTGYTLIPAVDVESYDGVQDASSMRRIIRAFIAEFQRISGITPVLYTYTSYANDILRGQFTDCPLWLADYRGYAGNVVSWGSWQAWQYSEHGQVEAIANNEVDLDYATSGIYMSAPVPANPSAPSCNTADYYEVSSLPQAANSRAGTDFYIRDHAGNRIGSHRVDTGDPLVILGVDLALIHI